MTAHFRHLLEAHCRRSSNNASVSCHCLPSPSVGNCWSSSTTLSAEFPQDVCLHQLIEQQVTRTPEQVAVVFEEEEVSYRELNERANQLAHHLRSLGVGPEIPVGILMERSVDLVAALLGVLKAGGAYVPLDPEYPAERLRFMLEDAQVAVLITQRAVSGAAARCHTASAAGDEDEAEMLRQYESSNPELLGGAENLAYIIYTSGSTGQPKGAMNTQRGIVNRLLWMQATYGLNEQDRVLQKTPFSFRCLGVGVFLALADRSAAGAGAAWRSSRWAVSARANNKGADHDAALRALDAARVSGGRGTGRMRHAAARDQQWRGVAGGSGRALLQPFGRAELHNLYGPTEAAVDVTWWECRREWERRGYRLGGRSGTRRCMCWMGSSGRCRWE